MHFRTYRIPGRSAVGAPSAASVEGILDNDMTLKNRNHYVPCLSLRRWADTESKLWVYRLLVSHASVPLWKHSSIDGIGYHRNLYTRILSGAETDEFENWLERDFETPAAEPLRKATADERLSSDDWECIIRFLAAQDVRTPARLVEFLRRQNEQLPGMADEVLHNVVSELTEAKRTGRKIERSPSDMAVGFPTRVTKEIEPGAEVGLLKVETVVGRGLWLWSLRPLLTETYKVLRTHKWTIVRPPLNMNWLTSDNPVVKLNYYAEDRYDFKGGWGRKGGQILMPLGPQHLLYTRIGDRPPWRKGDRVPESLALKLQTFIIENAHRNVYAVEADPLVAKIRPRVVNAAAFQSEADQWQRWGKEQSQPERDLDSRAPIQPAGTHSST
jgi:hypothetical protein